jgi:hypothetical protein
MAAETVAGMHGARPREIPSRARYMNVAFEWFVCSTI